MKTKSSYVSWVGAVVIALALVVAWRARIARGDAEAERTRFTQQWARLETGRSDSAKAPPVDPARGAAMTAPPIAGGKPPATATAAGGNAKSEHGPSSLQEHLSRLDNDPQLQVLQLARERSKLALKYGPLLHRLKLTPEETRRLSDLLMTAVANEEDLRAIARREGTSTKTAAFAEQRRLAHSEVRAAELALLGAEKLAQLEHYERALPVWTFVGQFAGLAAMADLPLSRAQTERLVEAVAAASPIYARGGKLESIHDTDWTAANEAARSILAEEQMKVFARVEPSESSRWSIPLLKAVMSRGSSAPRPPGTR